MSSRREFIKQSALAAGGILVSSSSFGNFFIGKKPKVVIIGAGFAGLSAAYYLHKKKIDFVILEARNRISGRVFSHIIDPGENMVIELGAEWVGNSHHRIHDLCGELGLLLENNQFESHLIYQGKYYKNKEWDYSEEWKKKFQSIIDGYEKLTKADKVSWITWTGGDFLSTMDVKGEILIFVNCWIVQILEKQSVTYLPLLHWLSMRRAVRKTKWI